MIRSDSTSNQAIFSKHTESGSNQLITGFWDSSDSGKVWHINLHSSAYLSEPIVTQFSEYMILEYILEKSGSNYIASVYTNGEIIADKFTMDNTPDLPLSGGKPWSIGQEWDSSTNETDEFDGDIAEFLVFDEVMAEKAEIRSYLAKK